MNKLSVLARRLEVVLAAMSQEEFNRQWAEIEHVGFHGPALDEVLEFLRSAPQVPGSFEILYSLDQDFPDNPSLALAA